ncbi:undecaprenyl-phosphate glucose phosphotransferase [Cupriavidus taiwanensis]|uniref:Undecaprenyl-phosphate galactosephosphotransferase n=2 Tax=Cupriavidus taiwanensis TaxID=164546 RepID=B2AHG8_CUPTR|nr:undecaprenyl-phosphate glucose phosphotransferase [Cupriavidus taiwanensis]CAP63217.1 undecaprenyl-phosphate galactosephosphotransferase [Cupriavidus taiwanensis LMG 19424]SOY65219.1 undecaprenyl-phosphate galactosephosphotransferase [Cupriavidus taiwanensis]SOZ09282.1 undecaprenyl-phosphate galactosephosphotransferase [Cupriavidus taiwanensis]SOZ11405.1 undecaprenyl-phosphate galactosephosphotransferase [Cupriavidus taiwanensis]SOZ42760.1 undecaprenyl-phosphate galactosephosphotransferase 
MASSSTFAAERHTALHLLYRLADAVLVGACAVVIGALYFPEGIRGAAPVHGFLAALCSIGVLAVFPAFGIYESWRGRSRAALVLRLLAAWTTVFIVGLMTAFLMHQIAAVSRVWSLGWFGSSLLALAGVRAVMFRMLGNVREQGINAKRVVIFGYGPLGREMYLRVDQIRAAGYRVVGIYHEEPIAVPDGVVSLRTMEEVNLFVRSQAVREIWLTLPMAACRDLYDVVRQFRNELIDIRWVPDVMSVELLGHRFSEFLGLPVIDLNSPPVSGITGLLKASFDRAFALAALVGLAPVLLVVAVLVKLSSPGPVLFRQRRLGMDGRPFDVFKFRTMRQHADVGVTQAVRGDARVTRVGAFLRRTSLDELPQFFNVLRGEMSVVGPRPHAMEHNELYKELIDRYMLRHRVKPGITGWAQINGLRGQTDTVEKMRRRIEFDIYYIQHWSFQLDLQIILRTALHGWTGASAY